MPPDPLPSDLAAALVAAAPRLGGFAEMRYHAEVDSTNDIAMGLASAGAPEGTAVLADCQRAGRGRQRRSWFSPPGAGLYLSVIVRPAGRPEMLPLVTLAAGVGIARAIHAATALPVELKWPNDVVLGRPWRKLGGVLCESVGVGSAVDAIVVGVGINLRSAAYPREIANRATSIEMELGRPVERASVVTELLASLADVTRRLWRREHGWICDEWRRFGRAGLGGASVQWMDQGVGRRGVARDIDEQGALLVDAGGRAERLVAGEVTWERLGRE